MLLPLGQTVSHALTRRGGNKHGDVVRGIEMKNSVREGIGTENVIKAQEREGI